MKCPTCVEQGERSTVTEGGGTTTLMGFSPFYDEDGVRHFHDGNTTTTSYRCSRGHSWSEKSKHRCSAPGCDFGVLLPDKRKRTR